MPSVRISASAILSSLVCIAAPCAAQPEPDTIVTRVNEASSSSYTGRFNRSTYSYDNGIAAFSIGTNSGPREFLWLHRYDAAGGEDAITSVSLAWGNIPAGTAARVYIFKDPNNDGIPADRVLLASQDITVLNPCSCTNPTYTVYPIDVPVPVSGVIYVGVSVVVQSGQFPVHADNATPFVAGRSFIASAVPPLNASTVALGVRSTPANPETYFIRANGSNAGFTYQGSLDVTGAAYTGNADLLVGIYDAASAGNAVSANFAIPGVAFNSGRFSVRIPADASSFDPGADRWLEIGVKRAGEATYTTLSPRQRITSVPTALAAARVNWNGVFNAPASFPPWNQISGGISYSAGRVGIGTTSPSDTLHVQGTALFSGPTNGGRIVTTDFVVGSGGAQLLGIATGNNGGPQFRFLTSSSATNFIDIGQNGNGDFVVEGNDNPRLVVANAGNVGIGNPSPATLLHIGSYSTGPNALRIAAAGAKTASLQFRFFSDNFGWNLDSVDDNATRETGLYLSSAFNSSTFTDRVFVSLNNGNVGIGTIVTPEKLTVNGNVKANNVVVPSSLRFKDNVAPMGDALASLIQLEGVRFDWKPEFAADRAGRTHDIGFVAEDVAKVFPEVVFYDADGNVTGMDYSRLTAVAVQAIKQQQARFEAELAKRDAQATAKQHEIDELKAGLDRLEAALKTKQ